MKPDSKGRLWTRDRLLLEALQSTYRLKKHYINLPTLSGVRAAFIWMRDSLPVYTTMPTT